jgi:ADP-ribosylglycohydrolase
MSLLDRLISKYHINQNVKLYLKSIWFGDTACSGGQHYIKGQQTSFEGILSLSDPGYSDDLIENLAMLALHDTIPSHIDLISLKSLCNRFYEFIKPHYVTASERYSPDYPQLFRAEELLTYFQVTVNHSNCGGAMRSGILGLLGMNDQDIFPLVAMTHLHPDAVAGAFAVSSAVHAASLGQSLESVIEKAILGAEEGEKMAKTFIDKEDKDRGFNSSVHQRIGMVLETRNPYCQLGLGGQEGIETRFVVPAVILIVSQTKGMSPDKALRQVVEQAYSIGGDPDTIASISMGILGAYWGDDLSTEIDKVLATRPQMKSGSPSFIWQ